MRLFQASLHLAPSVLISSLSNTAATAVACDTISDARGFMLRAIYTEEVHAVAIHPALLVCAPRHAQSTCEMLLRLLSDDGAPISDNRRLNPLSTNRRGFLPPPRLSWQMQTSWKMNCCQTMGIPWRRKRRRSLPAGAVSPSFPSSRLPGASSTPSRCTDDAFPEPGAEAPSREAVAAGGDIADWSLGGRVQGSFP